MDENIAVTLLKEFREFRVENDKRWKENDKRWKENDKRWEENNKRWEENDKRWEENNKRWEENTKSLKSLNAKIDEVNKNTNTRIDNLEISLNAKIDEVNKNTNTRIDNLEISLNAKIDEVNKNTNTRIDNVERIIKKDRIDLAGILDTMQKTITEQFEKQQEYMEAKFNKIFAAQRVNEIEHEKIFSTLKNHEKRLNFQNDRLEHLEQWKDEFDMGEFSAV